MNSLTTRTLTTLLLTTPILAQGEKPTAESLASLGYVAQGGKPPAQSLSGLGYVQSANQAKPGDTPASLVEQALYAEEHERDFTRAAELFELAVSAARQANDATQLERARKGLDRVAARKSGINVTQDDPLLGSIAQCITRMESPIESQDATADEAEQDVRLYGALAVPWLEKATTSSYQLADTVVRANRERVIRTLARMNVPEANAALQRMQKSADPLLRRSVAKHCEPDAQREVLLACLQDPTPSVRDAAVQTLARSKDPKLAPALESEARRGQSAALVWLASCDPTRVLAIASDAKLNESLRTSALQSLDQRDTLEQSPVFVDTLLGLARSGASPTVAASAMQLLADVLSGPWRPLAADIQKKVEATLTAAPDDYPQPAASYALLAVGGGPAIAASAKRLLAALDGMPEQSGEQVALVKRVESQLRQLQGDAFPYVVRAYSELPLADDRGSFRNAMLNNYRDSVRRLASQASSLEFAQSTQGLDGEKFAYCASLAARSLRERFGQGPRPGVKLEKEWLPLLRRMGASSDEEVRAAAMIGLGAMRDASVLPELIAASTDSSGRVQSAASSAMRYVLRADAANARRVLEDAMTTYVRQNGKHSTDLAGELHLLAPKDALELADRYWKESQDPWVRDALYRVVCDVEGPAALEFLLRKLPEMQASTGYARKLAVERFGNELYEPALDAMEQMLRDPDGSVREAARGAFAAFKAQRDALAEFAAWKATASEARTTIDELLKLTESPNVDVVVGAVKALGALKASAAYPKLVRLLERKEPEIKTAVQAALDKLGE